MLKRVEKIVVVILAFGMLFGGVMVAPAEATSTCNFSLPGGGRMFCDNWREGNTGVVQTQVDRGNINVRTRSTLRNNTSGAALNSLDSGYSRSGTNGLVQVQCYTNQFVANRRINATHTARPTSMTVFSLNTVRVRN